MTDLNPIFKVRVIPRAKVNKIIRDDDGGLRAYTTTAPSDGKANAAVIKLLSDFWNVPKSRIKIIRGETSRDKVITVQ